MIALCNPCICTLPSKRVELPLPERIDAIIKEVFSAFNVDMPEPDKKRGKRAVIDAKHVCIYIIRTRGKLLTCEAAAGKFQLTHSIATYAIPKVKNLLDTDKAFKATFDTIIKKLEGRGLIEKMNPDFTDLYRIYDLPGHQR